MYQGTTRILALNRVSFSDCVVVRKGYLICNLYGFFDFWSIIEEQLCDISSYLDYMGPHFVLKRQNAYVSQFNIFETIRFY